MAKKKITKKQLEDYINLLKEYRDNELKSFIEGVQKIMMYMTDSDSSNPITPPPKPPILK